MEGRGDTAQRKQHLFVVGGFGKSEWFWGYRPQNTIVKVGFWVLGFGVQV